MIQPRSIASLIRCRNDARRCVLDCRPRGMLRFQATACFVLRTIANTVPHLALPAAMRKSSWRRFGHRPAQREVSLGGEYGGLGANYKIWSGNARATIPF
jgi:hypothetical protein